MNLKLLENILKKGGPITLSLITAVCLLGSLQLVWPVQAQGPPGLPATYYGMVQAGNNFVPTAGMTVTAYVNGNLCGENQTQSHNSEIVYQINVMGAGPNNNGCGTLDRSVTLFIESQEMAPMMLWDNSQVHEVDLYPVDTSPISRTISLQTGWTHISLPLFSTTSYTAQSLCDEMISQGASVVEIDRWHTGGWQGHLCGLPFNDFAIEQGSSYFIRSHAASTWTITGQPITSAIPLNLQVGWNAISIPHTDSYTAESLCDDIINQGVTAVEIDRWHSGGWEGHICNQPFNDFAIERGVGYFIKSSSSGSVTPTQHNHGRQE